MSGVPFGLTVQYQAMGVEGHHGRLAGYCQIGQHSAHGLGGDERRAIAPVGDVVGDNAGVLVKGNDVEVDGVIVTGGEGFQLLQLSAAVGSPGGEVHQKGGLLVVHQVFQGDLRPVGELHRKGGRDVAGVNAAAGAGDIAGAGSRRGRRPQ